MAPQGAMFDEFVEGGFLDDAEVRVESARFAPWDYRGKQPQPVLALNLKLKDSEGKEHDEYLSSGELRFFVPSEDGKRAIPVGTQQKLNSNTNAAAFILSIFNADTRGELAAKLKATDDISILDGTIFHVVRKAQPKRSGIIQQPTEGGNNRAPTRLEVEKVVKYSWEAGAPATGTAARPVATTATAAAPAAAGAPSDLDASIAAILLGIVAEAGGSLKKGSIAGKVFADAGVKAMPVPERNAVLARIVNDAFLNGDAAKSMGISYDAAAATVSLG